MERSAVRDFIVGLFLLAGLGAIAYLSISIGGFAWHVHGGLKIFASFGETGDLTVRAPVRIAGVKVGEVTSIKLDKDFRARVGMDLDPNLKVDTDTFASIVTAGMLGDKYIELQPGGADKMLKSGDEITHCNDAVILEKLLGQVVYGLTKDNGSGDKNSPASEPKK